MKKTIALLYFTLTWFVCIGQTTFYNIVSFGNSEDPQFYFDQDGQFERAVEDNMTRVQFENYEIHHYDNYVHITVGDNDLILVTEDCLWITQYVLYYNGIVVDMYNFNVPKLTR